jgi:hypothetical protein
MKSSLTYGQLYEKLRQLDFSQNPLAVKGKPQYLFEHKTIPDALLFLPRRNQDDVVEPFFIRSVLALLKGRNLVTETDLLSALMNGAATADPHSATTIREMKNG